MDRCLNCGTPLTGHFCSECGQPAQLKPLSFWTLLKDLIEDIWDVDSKAWRSLRPLMIRPGFLTNEYLAGRRASYVAPLRLYLTASVLFFIAAAFTDNAIRVSWGDADAAREQIEAAGQTDDTNVIISQEGGCEAILEGESANWSDYWRQRGYDACKKVAEDSGRSLERAAVDNIPIMMVVFIPVLALFMLFLYPFSRRYYVEHLVFFLHYHAFGFFMLLLVMLIYEFGSLFVWSQTGWRIAGFLSSGYMALYLLIAMRVVYRQGWIASSVKYFLLFLAYVTGLSMSMFGVIIYTALTL